MFQHRYDYRAEWLRFTRTIGNIGDGRRWGVVFETTLPVLPSSIENARLDFKARWQESNYTGQATSAVEYLVESTVLPDVYVVEPYEIALMSVDYSKQLSKQDLADIVAFMAAIGQ